MSEPAAKDPELPGARRRPPETAEGPGTGREPLEPGSLMTEHILRHIRDYVGRPDADPAHAASFVPQLTAMLNHANGEVVKRAAETLGRLGPAAESAYPRLVELAERAPEPWTWARAAIAVAPQRTIDFIRALTRWLADPAPSSWDHLKPEAARFLVHVGAPASAEILEILPALAAQSDFDDPRLRAIAERIIRSLQSPAVDLVPYDFSVTIERARDEAPR